LAARSLSLTFGSGDYHFTTLDGIGRAQNNFVSMGELRIIISMQVTHLLHLETPTAGKDVAVNPADTEEAIWAFLCEAQVDGFEEARRKMLIVQTDPRPYMRRAYELFKGTCSEEDLAKEGANLSSPAAFYALLYLGLYAEARDEADKARNYIHASVATPYGNANRDYMAGLARVHLIIRKWI